MKYRKTELVDAEQFDGSDEMAKKYKMLELLPFAGNWSINTFQGEVYVHVGDWIATSVDGEHWPIADDVFKRTYEPVEEK
ncbi:hypothetical protein IWT140_02215 [Secundilactobacillus pentosiphilus]|uniref:Prophage protein n=1 Tax=Secundilactobacillus pentosiphilus TaxID=1714682 RepID=A0A1Z5IS20_9LACO|nr:hypothetical protein [Secundilactobacillus pentosiphilus]GAX04573.1 hypothetical protein IWT140_02215 [Secundilactobacillus pentosiphilus]